MLAAIIATVSAYTNTAICRKYTKLNPLTPDGLWKTWKQGPLFTVDILNEKTLRFTAKMKPSQVFGINFSSNFNEDGSDFIIIITPGQTASNNNNKVKAQV